MESANQQIYSRIQAQKSVDTVLCMENTAQQYQDNKFILPYKSSFLHTADQAKQYAQSLTVLANSARALVRDIDPQNDVQLIRIQTSSGNEIISTVDKQFRLIVVT